MAKYTGQVTHDAHPSFILCTEWISCCQHGEQILQNLAGHHSKLSSPDLDYMVSVNLQGTRITEMVPVFETDSETKGCECQFMKLQQW